MVEINPSPPRCIPYSTDTEQNSEYRVFEKHEYFIEFFIAACTLLMQSLKKC